MSGITVVVLLLAGCALLILSGFGKQKIKMRDLALVLIPLLLWMIGIDRIQKSAVGVIRTIGLWIENYVPTSWLK